MLLIIAFDVGDAIEAVYRRTCRNQPRVCRMSPASAELTKLALNCFVTMKIAYCNAIADIADATPDANSKSILSVRQERCVFDFLFVSLNRTPLGRSEAIGSDSRIGSKCMMPGYGFGGPVSCASWRLVQSVSHIGW